MTQDQHIASDPEISVWVSASAGTGKTKVLTDRVLRLLLAGSRPSKILCITYTKAAAAEMEHRIEAQLGNWAIAPDMELQKTLTDLTGKTPDMRTVKRARQLFALVLDAPERIRIQTIHGFCQSVLKRFPLEAGVPPHFTLIEGHTSAELLDEARRRLFGEPDGGDCATAIEAIATRVGEKTFDNLIVNIIDDRSRFTPWFEQESGMIKLRNRLYEKSGFSANDTEETLFDKHFHYSDEELHTLKAACAALAQGEGESDKRTCNALQFWLSGPSAEKSASYSHAYLTGKHEPRKTLCTKATEKSLPLLKDILLAEQQRVFAFITDLKSFHVIKATNYLIILAYALLGIYQRLKDSHGYLDYDDIIQRTASLLHQKNAAAWVLYKLDGGIDHLLVDEAQDTSPEQWRLVDALTTEFFSGIGAQNAKRTLFVVGDGKQSIFSFQGAEPAAFDIMQNRLRKRITGSGMEFRNIQLALSFRSTEAVLQAVDDVFSSDPARDGLVFSENYINHQAHRKGMAGRVEVWPLVEIAELEVLSSWHVTDTQLAATRPETLLAGNIAQEIKEWLDKKRKIASEDRPVQPGDIMILVQRRGRFASAMLRALKKGNIAVAGADRLILTEHIAIADCIALAEFLLLPQDDLILATVLKSPFIGLSEEALFELAYDRKNLSLWQRLKANTKFLSPCEFLSGLLAKADYLPPYELFAYILETLGGRRKLVQRLGMEIEDPLNEFLGLALQYGDVHTPSLQGFLHWLQSGVAIVKRDMEKTRDEVRIMTVHGAKGLQAPIVFLPDTTRLPRHDGGILWTKEPESIPLWPPSAEDEDKHCRTLKEVLRLDSEREYRRLLYVAMTRAEDELYVCGWKGGAPVSDKSWYALIRQAAKDKWRMENDKLILLSEQTTLPRIKPAHIRQTAHTQLPYWVDTSPVKEPSPSRPLSPSHMEPVTAAGSPLQDQTARLRGLLIHRLLQYLPDVNADERETVIERFISRHGNDFSQSIKDSIKQDVRAIFQHPDFAHLFSGDSIAEAPVSGMVYGDDGIPVILSGQIDRLIVLEDAVYIIDYKTNTHVPETEAEVPESYIKQMAAYRRLIARIYPDKTIRCALLWTSAPKLMLLTS